MKWLLLFLALNCSAGTYLVVTDTNSVFPAGVVTWKECIEAEHFSTISSNWIEAVVLPSTNNSRLIHQNLVLVTNHTIRFRYDGEVYTEHKQPQMGPVIDKRVLEVPMPLPPPQIPLRTTNRFRLKTNVVVEPVP